MQFVEGRQKKNKAKKLDQYAALRSVHFTIFGGNRLTHYP